MRRERKRGVKKKNISYVEYKQNIYLKGNHLKLEVRGVREPSSVNAVMGGSK